MYCTQTFRVYAEHSAYSRISVAFVVVHAFVGAAAVAMFSAPSYEILMAGRVTYGLGVSFRQESFSAAALVKLVFYVSAFRSPIALMSSGDVPLH